MIPAYGFSFSSIEPCSAYQRAQIDLSLSLIRIPAPIISSWIQPVIFYPFQSILFTYNIAEVKKVLLSGNYGVVAAQDGYLLLKRGLPSPGISPFSPAQQGDDDYHNLPDEFCSFRRVSPQQVTHPLKVDFSSNRQLKRGCKSGWIQCCASAVV